MRWSLIDILYLRRARLVRLFREAGYFPHDLIMPCPDLFRRGAARTGGGGGGMGGPMSVPATAARRRSRPSRCASVNIGFGVAVPMLDRRKHHRLRMKARDSRLVAARHAASGSHGKSQTLAMRERFKVGQPLRRSMRWSGSPDDIRRCGANIPKRNQRQGCALCARMPPEIANRC